MATWGPERRNVSAAADRCIRNEGDARQPRVKTIDANQPVITAIMVADLEAAIKDYLEHHNDDPRPFIWTAPAADILKKVSRGETSVRVGTIDHRLFAA